MADRINKIPDPFCSNAGLPGAFTSALSFNEQVQWLLNAYNNLLAMIPDNVEFNGVKYVEQSLNGSQKEIARNNIGAGTSNITDATVSNTIRNNCVLYKNTQELTDEQKEIARNNIGAALKTSDEKFLYYSPQTLTQTERKQSRANIRALATEQEEYTDEVKAVCRNNIKAVSMDEFGYNITYENPTFEDFVNAGTSYVYSRKIGNLFFTFGNIKFKSVPENLPQNGSTVFCHYATPINLEYARKNNDVFIDKTGFFLIDNSKISTSENVDFQIITKWRAE